MYPESPPCCSNWRTVTEGGLGGRLLCWGRCRWPAAADRVSTVTFWRRRKTLGTASPSWGIRGRVSYSSLWKQYKHNFSWWWNKDTQLQNSHQYLPWWGRHQPVCGFKLTFLTRVWNARPRVSPCFPCLPHFPLSQQHSARSRPPLLCSVFLLPTRNKVVFVFWSGSSVNGHHCSLHEWLRKYRLGWMWEQLGQSAKQTLQSGEMFEHLLVYRFEQLQLIAETLIWEWDGPCRTESVVVRQLVLFNVDFFFLSSFSQKHDRVWSEQVWVGLKANRSRRS